MSKSAMATSKSEVFYTAELGDDILVRVISYNEHTGVDIRKWQTSSTHNFSVPTKKGIRLTPQNWSRLVRETRDSTIKILSNEISMIEEKIDIGRAVYISRPAGTSYIHIRQWYMGEDEDNVEKPGKKGVCMQLKHFKQLISKTEEIQRSLPEESRVTPCYLDDDHQNQFGYLLCSDCNPYEYNNYTITCENIAK